MTIREAGSTVVVLVAVLCAVVTTVVTVRREFFSAARTSERATAPTPVKNWHQYVASGHRMGPANATVTIVEFADFECPACRSFALHVLPYVRAKYPNNVAILFRHWPLEYHRFAYPTARAAECAAAQGRFEPFASLIYEKQDSLGFKTFDAFAKESGVADSAAFARCSANPARVAAIDADEAVAKASGGTGTPTLMINGLLIPGVPDSTRMDQYIHDAIIRTTADAKSTR